MLSPLGVIFGLFVAFTAAQVWNDNGQANATIDREASALRSVVILAASFPGEPEMRLRALVRDYISEAANQEWPMMAEGTATLKKILPSALGEALQLTLSLTPGNKGQELAQREIAAALESALEHAASDFSSVDPKVNLSEMGVPDLAGNLRVTGDRHRAQR